MKSLKIVPVLLIFLPAIVFGKNVDVGHWYSEYSSSTSFTVLKNDTLGYCFQIPSGWHLAPPAPEFSEPIDSELISISQGKQLSYPIISVDLRDQEAWDLESGSIRDLGGLPAREHTFHPSGDGGTEYGFYTAAMDSEKGVYVKIEVYSEDVNISNKAPDAYERVIESFKRNCPPISPSTLKQASINFNTMGYQRYKMGKYSEAFSYFERAHEADRSNPKPVFNAACSLALLKYPEPAISWLEKYISLNPGGWAQKVIADKDFDPIRQTPEFIGFMKSHAKSDENR